MRPAANRLRRAGQRGFTLIELMVAMGTVMITVLGLIGALQHVFAAEQLGEQRDQAVTYLASIASELRRVPLSEIARYAPTPPVALRMAHTVTIAPRDSAGSIVVMSPDGPAATGDLTLPLELRVTLQARPAAGPPFTLSSTILRNE